MELRISLLLQGVAVVAEWSGISYDGRRLASSPLIESVCIIFIVFDLLIKLHFLCYHNYHFIFHPHYTIVLTE